jgi:hypothetical protein
VNLKPVRRNQALPKGPSRIKSHTGDNYMAITTTYSWTSNVTSSFTVNNVVTAGSQAGVAIAALDNGSYYATWDDSTSPLSVEGRAILPGGSPLNSEFIVNSIATNAQFDSASAALNTGAPANSVTGPVMVVTFTDFSIDPSGDIRGRYFNSNGSANGSDFNISLGSGHDVRSDVAALSNGDFVVSWTRQFGGGDNDIDFQVMNVAQTSFVDGFVDSSPALNTDNSSVAGLTGGGFVIAYEQSPKAGGSTSVYFRQYDNSGNPLAATSHQIDNIGTINNDIQVVALHDGGFAVAYTDNGWSSTNTDITLQIFNADGNQRTGFIEANSITAGDQNHPSLTTLSNGDIVLGWSDGGVLHEQVFDPAGNRLAGENATQGSVVEAEIAGLTGGLVANVRSSTIPDAGGDNSIRSSIDEFSRTSVGDSASDTLTGDSLRDHFTGGGGSDTFVFARGGGLDNITDFTHGTDKIDLGSFHMTLDTALANATQIGGNTVFDLGSGDKLTLDGVVKDSLNGSDFTGLKATSNDYNGDNFSDILFRNNSTGDTGYTDVHNNVFHSLGGSPTAYSVVGSGDYNGDGFSDILLRNNSTGDTGYTDLHNNVFQSLGGSPVAYSVVGSGDYNGDGFSDILLRNNSTGDSGYTDLHNNVFNSLGGSPAAYSVVGSGDYNGDGFSDILLRNNSTGDTGYTDLHNNVFQSLGGSPVAYSVVGSGDFNGDGFSDILLRNNSTGDTGYASVEKDGFFQSLGGSPVAYSVVGTSDYNGDGFSEVLFRDNSTGDTGYTDIHNNVFHSLGGSPAAYLVVA